MNDYELMRMAEDAVLTCTVATEPKAKNVKHNFGWAHITVHARTLRNSCKRYKVTISEKTGKVHSVDSLLDIEPVQP